MSSYKKCILVIICGIVTSLISCLYRYLIQISDTIFLFLRNHLFAYILFSIISILIMMTLTKLEPSITGSGIPQIKAELSKHHDNHPLKVILYKIINGCLSICNGLSLGRAGPSIHLSGMTGKMIAEYFKQEKELYIMCGMAAGLSATFHAPIAGLLFVLEEIKPNKKHIIYITISSIIGCVLSLLIFSSTPTLNLHAELQISLISIFVMGITCGLFGQIYIYITLLCSKLYSYIPLKSYQKMIIPVILSIIISQIYPLINTGGGSIVTYLQDNIILKSLIILFISKLLFTLLCSTSGSSGGTFYPVLVLGVLIGGILSFITNDNIYSMMIISSAALFASVMHTPITAIVMICEMTLIYPSYQLILTCLLAYGLSNILLLESLNKELYKNLIRR